jgi:hypothetical protein
MALPVDRSRSNSPSAKSRSASARLSHSLLLPAQGLPLQAIVPSRRSTPMFRNASCCPQ